MDIALLTEPYDRRSPQQMARIETPTEEGNFHSSRRFRRRGEAP